jgi:hsp70-interacting protein
MTKYEFHNFSQNLPATKNEDRTGPSNFEQMDPERRRFLEEAMKSMTVDVVEELNKAMNILIKAEATEDEQVNALEVVTNFVADIDTANGEESKCVL